MAAAACAHCSPILAAFPNLVLPAHPRSRACSGEWSITMSYRYANLPIEQVRANAKNARTHSKKQIRQIANSIDKLGFGSTHSPR
jgi:hypothetical protein